MCHKKTTLYFSSFFHMWFFLVFFEVPKHQCCPCTPHGSMWSTACSWNQKIKPPWIARFGCCGWNKMENNQSLRELREDESQGYKREVWSSLKAAAIKYAIISHVQGTCCGNDFQLCPSWESHHMRCTWRSPFSDLIRCCTDVLCNDLYEVEPMCIFPIKSVLTLKKWCNPRRTC